MEVGWLWAQLWRFLDSESNAYGNLSLYSLLIQWDSSVAPAKAPNRNFLSFCDLYPSFRVGCSPQG